MTARAPDLDLDLVRAAHPSRTARKEIRRFLATRSVGLVEDAGVATTEAVRRAARANSALPRCAIRLQIRSLRAFQPTRC